MKVYDKHLSDIVELNQTLTIDFKENNNVLMLDMEKGALNTKTCSINEVKNLETVFPKIIKKKSDFSTRICEMSASMVCEHLSHIAGKERVNLQATTLLRLTNCLLESPSITIFGNKMSFENCFLLNPKVLNIIGNQKDSNYNTIQIVFRDNPKIPTIMYGHIDLNNDDTKQELVFSNVKKIRVLFNPQAWNKAEKDNKCNRNMFHYICYLFVISCNKFKSFMRSFLLSKR